MAFGADCRQADLLSCFVGERVTFTFILFMLGALGMLVCWAKAEKEYE